MPITQEELESYIRRLRANDPSLTSLDLSGRGITGRDAEEIVHALERNETLLSLDLSFNSLFSEDSEHGVSYSIALMLSNNEHLASLNLRHTGMINSDAIVIGFYFDNSLSHAALHTLTSLDLGENGIGDDGVEAITSIFKKSWVLTSVKFDGNEVNLKGQDFLDEIAKTVERNIHAAQKERKQMQWQKDHPEEMRKREEAWQRQEEKRAIKMRELHEKHERELERERKKIAQKKLRKCHKAREGEKTRIARELQHGLASPATSSSSFIPKESDSSISSFFSRFISQLRANIPDLVAISLNVEDMPIPPPSSEDQVYDCNHGICAVIETLKFNHTVTWLDLSQSYSWRSFDDGSVGKALMELLITNQAPRLTSIRLQQWNFSLSSIDIAGMLQSNVTLASLSFAYNTYLFGRMNGKEKMDFADILRTNDTLLAMDLSTTEIDDEALRYLASAMNDNHALLCLQLDGNNFSHESEPYLQSIITCLKRNAAEYVKKFPLHAALLFDDVTSEIEAKALRSHDLDKAGRTPAQIREIRRTLNIENILFPDEEIARVLSRNDELLKSGTASLSRLLAAHGLFGRGSASTAPNATVPPPPPTV